MSGTKFGILILVLTVWYLSRRVSVFYIGMLRVSKFGQDFRRLSRHFGVKIKIESWSTSSKLGTNILIFFSAINTLSQNINICLKSSSQSETRLHSFRTLNLILSLDIDGYLIFCCWNLQAFEIKIKSWSTGSKFSIKCLSHHQYQQCFKI